MAPKKTTPPKKSAKAGNDNPGGRKSSVGLDIKAPKTGGVFTQPLDLVYSPKPGNDRARPTRKPVKKK